MTRIFFDFSVVASIFTAYSRVLDQHKSWLSSYTKQSLTLSELHTAHMQALKIADNYQTVMVKMRDEVARSLANYDLHAMGVAICIIWMVRIDYIKPLFYQKYGLLILNA